MTLNHSRTLDKTDRPSSVRPLTSKTREVFEGYFDSGLNVATAIEFHLAHLEMTNIHGVSDFERELDDATINPCKQLRTFVGVRRWHDEWMKRRQDATYDVVSQVIGKTEAYAERGISVMLKEDPLVICIVTPLMRCAHLLRSAKKLVLMDSTSKCDSEDRCITLLLTPCAAGVVPLCILITANQTQREYEEGFELLKAVMGTDLFGRGRSTWPATFVTDDSDAQRQAIFKTWPASQCRTSASCVSQGVWAWLRDGQHRLSLQDKQALMKEFHRILRAASIAEAELSYCKAKISKTGRSCCDWLAHLDLQWAVRQRWCRAWNTYEMRSAYNRFTEMAVRVYKDLVLSRCKSFNTAALVHFAVTTLEPYWIRRLQCFANASNPSIRHMMELQLTKSPYVPSDIQKLSQNVFIVAASKSDATSLCDVVVDVEMGVCDCPDGKRGKLCQHQIAVCKHVGDSLPTTPTICVQDLREMADIASGDAEAELSFDVADISGDLNPIAVRLFVEDHQETVSIVINEEPQESVSILIKEEVQESVSVPEEPEEVQSLEVVEEEPQESVSIVIEKEAEEPVSIPIEEEPEESISIATIKEEPQEEQSLALSEISADLSSIQTVQCVHDSAQDKKLSALLEELKRAIEDAHVKFGSSKEGLAKLTGRMKSFRSREQWESFLNGEHDSATTAQPTNGLGVQPLVTRRTKRLASEQSVLAETKKRPRRLNK